jgi:hypothetical protein
MVSGLGADLLLSRCFMKCHFMLYYSCVWFLTGAGFETKLLAGHVDSCRARARQLLCTPGVGLRTARQHYQADWRKRVSRKSSCSSISSLSAPLELSTVHV